MNSEWAVIYICLGAIAVTLGLVIRLYFLTKKLNDSIAKLGYVIREDAKKYFDDASSKIVETNDQFESMYISIVEKGTRQALADTGNIMEGTLTKATTDAESIVMNAQNESRHITDAAREESEAYFNQIIQNSSSVIQWVIEQYAGQTFSVEEHQALIKRLLDEYINENRT